MAENSDSQLILVADDSPLNLTLLRRALQKEGYRILEAKDGIQVLELVEEETPDLFLLDVIMPRMDGFETCRRIKDDPRFKLVPVIFLTAKTGKRDKLLGLELGASDYVGKPFDISELIARVRTQLRMKSLYEENLSYQQALLESQRATSIKTLTKGIAHNFNNLLTGVTGYLELAISQLDKGDPVLRGLLKARSAAHQMQEVTKLLHEYIRPDFNTSGQELISLQTVLQQVISLVGASEKSVAEAVSLHLPEESLIVHGDPYRLEQALVNLLQNSFEAIGEGGKIQIQVRRGVVRGRGYILIEIRDNGRGIPKELLPIVKEPFVTTKKTVGVGLGLTVAERIVKEHDGILEITSQVNKGTKVSLYLPEREVTNGG